MTVEKIKLLNFRNHREYELSFRTETAIITGGNGWGKTSILEAIYLGLVGRSFRGTDIEMLCRGKEFYRVEMERDGVKVIIRYDGNKRLFEVDGRKTIRLQKQNRYPVVLFLPSDLHLVSSSPTRRRDYFDSLLIMIDDMYRVALAKYNKALRQRNEILRKGLAVNMSDVFSWDVMLAKYGVEIAQKRKGLIEEINSRISATYKKIAGIPDKCGLSYDTQDLDEDGYMVRLASSFEKDKIVGHTGVGVHRDNIGFVFNEDEADGNASRGETRSFMLALKFIEAELLEGAHNKKPVILLDDVFSELDEVRQKKLVSNFKENQVIITSVSVADE